MAGVELSQRKEIPFRKIIILLSLFYSVGVAGHIPDATFDLMLLLTPYTILATIILAVFPYIVWGQWRLFVWAAVTAVVTLSLEIIGVKTGAIFGGYDYGATLGFKLLGVPVLIGLNWVIVVLGAIALMEEISAILWQRVLGAAVFTVIFDMVLEPVAMALDYWDWDGGIIPVQNYIAWGFISAASALLYGIMGLSYRKNRLIPAVFIIQLIFFGALRIVVI
jgi:putative membrane protein